MPLQEGATWHCQPGNVLPPLVGEPAADGFGDPLLGRTVPADRSTHETCRGRGGTGTRAGTGVISRALLDGGVPAERLIVVEIVPEMANHLRGALPGVLVVEGDARNLPDLLPRHWHGRIGSVVCGIPLVLQPLAEQRRFIAAIEAVAPGRGFLHYSYCATSPLPLPQACPGGAARSLDATQLSAGERVALHHGVRRRLSSIRPPDGDHAGSNCAVRLRAVVEFLVHRLPGGAAVPVAAAVRHGADDACRRGAAGGDADAAAAVAGAERAMGAPGGGRRADQQRAVASRALRHGPCRRGTDRAGADAQSAADRAAGLAAAGRAAATVAVAGAGAGRRRRRADRRAGRRGAVRWSCTACC